MMKRSKTLQPYSSVHFISLLRQVAATAILLVMLQALTPSPLAAQQPATVLSAQAVQQIDALTREKELRTPAQRKMSSRLVYAMKMARGEPVASGVATLRIALPDVNGRGVVLDVRAQVTDALLADLRALGAEIVHASARYNSVRVRVDLRQAEGIAALPGVSYLQPKQEAITPRTTAPDAGPAATGALLIRGLRQRRRLAQTGSSIGSRLGGGVDSIGSAGSQGDVVHRADVTRATFGVSGAGVKVGVLSNGIGGLAQSQALGDLGAVTVLPGQEGSGAQGTAMLEIVHDLAPNAALYFATGVNGLESFADNIRALRNAGCDIIVDDVQYAVETPFQDGQSYPSPTNGGIVAQAVKDVSASGALYFSAAADFGKKSREQSATWEGNFADAGAAGSPLLGSGQLHNFGGQTYDVLTTSDASTIALFWSDALGRSTNDYDLYRLDRDGNTIVDASTDVQNGSHDPIEMVAGGEINQRLVIVKYSGSARFLHLATYRNPLQISTAGATHGHAATSAANSFGVAATAAATPYTGGTTPGPYPNPYNPGNKVETFTSDGPRRVFYTGTGDAITPGNLLTTGGLLLQKPDFAAADGVSVSGSGGFPTIFYGTSAAAAHAAAIAALVKSKDLALLSSQVRLALFSSAIDIEGAGVDRDSGIGIVMADSAVAAAAARHDGDFDGDGVADLTVFRPGSGRWYTLGSGSSYTSYTDAEWGIGTDIPVPADYDGDGRSDIAVFRPSSGIWWMLLSTSGFATPVSYAWGIATDLPVPRDYDGDGKADIAIYRPSTGAWWVLQSSTGFTGWVSYQWGGATGDVPVPGDYDGDGTADVAIYRPGSATWWVLQSSSGFTNFFSHAWGGPGSIPVPADYDGDGKADLGIYDAPTGVWWVLQSATGFAEAITHWWGDFGDVPMPADYDRDGKADFAIYRPSNGAWSWLQSSTGGTTFVTHVFGGSDGDVPVR
jgi:hypothetical protein